MKGARSRLQAAGYFEEVVGEIFDGLDLSTLSTRVVRFKRCSFVGTDLRHATFDGCWFTTCDLGRADLRAASLRGALIRGCDLRGADLSDSDLTDATIGFPKPASTVTDLTGVILKGAVLTGAVFQNVDGVTFTDLWM